MKYLVELISAISLEADNEEQAKEKARKEMAKKEIFFLTDIRVREESNSPSYAEEALEDAEKRKAEAEIKDFQKKVQERLDKEDVSSHYEGDVEPIDLMAAQFSPEAYMGFVRGNIIKYATRFGKKDTKLHEAKKIYEYAKYLLNYVRYLEEKQEEEK